MKFLIFFASLMAAVPRAMFAQSAPHEIPKGFSVHQYFQELYKDYEQKHPPRPMGPGWTVSPLAARSSAHALSKEVFGYLPYWFNNRWNLLDYSLISTISYFSGEINADGTIVQTHGWPSYPGDPSASANVINMINRAHTNGVKVVLCLTNFDGGQINTIVSTPSIRTTLIQRALALVVAANADGININFEGIQSGSRDNLTTFMRELADTLHTRRPGSQVSCAPTDFDTRPGDWDIAAIQPFIDLFFFQGYGYAWSTGPVAGPVGLLPNTPLWGGLNITTLIDFVLQRIDTTKVILGVPHYGYRWPTASGNVRAATQGSGTAFYYPDALVVIATRGRQWEPVAGAPWYKYQDGTQWYQGWYDDPQSMAAKYQFVLNRNLHGVGMWALGMDGSNHDIWDVLQYYFSDSTTILRTPRAPTLATVTDSSSAFEGRVHISWFTNTEAYLGGYRLYKTTDAFHFPGTPYLAETALDKNANAVTITGLSLDSTYYFRLVAVDSSHTQVSDTSDTYGVRPGQGPRYLVVDGFDRTTASYNMSHHSFNAYYGDPIAAAGRKFDSADNDAVINGLIGLQDYEGIIWFLGDESVSDRTFTATEQSIVETYLNNGGKLFVTGSEIGYDLGRAASPNYSPAFYNGYLKATYVGDAASGLAFTGVAGSIFQGISGSFGQTYPEDYPDYIGPTGGSTVALIYNASQNAAVQYEGTFGSGIVPGRLVNMGFTYETIASPVTRNSLMARILTFFDGQTTVDDGGTGAPREFALQQNYPNPFNPTTTIRFSVGTSGGASSHVMIQVFDVLGREVATLVNGPMKPGTYNTTFSGNNLASGVYLYRLTANGLSFTHKMILAK